MAYSDHNSPIQLSPDESRVYTANADTRSMSVVNVSGDTNALVAEVRVGREPMSVAAHPDGARVFVANMQDGTVSVVSTADFTVSSTIAVVADDPYGLAMTHDGDHLLVTGAGSNEIVVIDTDSGSAGNHTVQSRLDLLSAPAITGHAVLAGVGALNPRGIAVTDDDGFAVVTLFLALPATAPTRGVEAFDDGKSGYALLLDLSPLAGGGAPQVADVAELPAMANSTFTANRTPFCPNLNANAANDTYCPDPSSTNPQDPAIITAPQAAFPNLLQSVSFLPGTGLVYFASIGSQPEPPVKFNVNIQALISRATLDVVTPRLTAGAPFNANAGVGGEPFTELNHLFFSTLWDLRFKPSTGYGTRTGYALAAGSDVAVRIQATEATGELANGAPGAVRVKLGKNPRGLAINTTGSRLYSYNHIGRSVTAVDITNDGAAPVVLGEIAVAAQPEPGTPAARVQLGQELFNAALGPEVTELAADGRNVRFTMSDNGWGSCFNCHPFGLADGVTWIFANGPRQTPPLDGTFNPLAQGDQRVLNWSAVFSSVQDFEKNVENVSGGFGLIGPNGSTDGVVSHGANRGRDERYDAIAEYVKTIRSPVGTDVTGGDAAAGREIFGTQQCWRCHGGGKWSTSFQSYPLPATAVGSGGIVEFVGTGPQIAAVNGVPLLQNIGTFDAGSVVEIRADGQAALGAAGFNPPSLLGTTGHAPYFHDGRFGSLAAVVDSQHQVNGTLTPTEVENLVAFLESIDDTTAPFGASEAWPTVRPSHHSSPITTTEAGNLVLVVNPDNDSLTIIDTASDTKIYEVTVGDEPRSVAVNSAATRAYVANFGDGTVSAIDLSYGAPVVLSSLAVGAGPYGVALTPNDTYLLVASSGSDSVSVIQTSTWTVSTTIPVGPNPRGIGITDDGDGEDSDEKAYVTMFLGQLREGGGEAFDQGKEGQVAVIDIGTAAVIRTLRLPGMKDSGFKADRTAFSTQSGAVNNTFAGGSAEPQGTFPNLLQSVFVRGNRVYFASLGASPEPPVKFNVNVQALITVADAVHDTATQRTLNMNSGVQFEVENFSDPLQKLFFSLPWQLAARTDTPVGYTVVSGSNVVVRTELDDQGASTINAATAGPVTTSPITRIEVGKNPMGITILPNNSKAYVMNYISRDVSVIDLGSETVTRTVQSAALPAAGSDAETVLLGKWLFNTSRGNVVTGTAADGRTPRFEMSDNGWGSCFNCHPFGQADGVTWVFDTGPRQTIPLDSTFGLDDDNIVTPRRDPLAGLTQRILNWSAVRTLTQDFEKNIENVSGGFGLIGVNGAADGVVNHGANRGLSDRWDAIEAYVASIEAPPAPLADSDSSVVAGRQVFLDAGCDTCHSGNKWTISAVAYNLPASSDPNVILSSGQVLRVGSLQILFDVATFDSESPIELRGAGNLGKAPLGAAGFNVPSLLGISAHAPYFHDGSALTLDDVLDNLTHRQIAQQRAARLGRPAARRADPIDDPTNRSNLVAFLQSIDSASAVIPPPTFDPEQVPAASAAALALLAAVLMLGAGLRLRRRVSERSRLSAKR
ncbi:MAG: hypothetical protein HYV63_23200 [Candidatus Schekmanbacteria bacterium]|nr:hypothetical protein [Candidatus Schekmanbacteria bacterium]